MTLAVTVLGATGSIGRSTLDIIARNPDLYHVHALTAHKSVDELAALARTFRPKHVVIADESCLTSLRDQLAALPSEIRAGSDAVADVARDPVHCVVAGIVGAVGIAPVMAAVDAGNRIALANKEALICAGDLLLDRARQSGAEFLPVDSEHNAIFQVLEQKRPEAIQRLILTASGGPFRSYGGNLAEVTPAQALAHPTWDMGPKISIDSATLMNKGLEVIEAYYLFPVTVDQLSVVVHPQSVVHSMVEYVDGSILAQMGSADMRIPIGYALGYPDRLKEAGDRLDFSALASLSFEKPDMKRFPCLQLAFDALKAGGAAPLVMNAANEVAVHHFLAGDIRFTDIPLVIAAMMDKIDMKAPQCLDTVRGLDAEVRTHTETFVQTLGSR